MSTHYDKKGVCPIKLVIYIVPRKDIRLFCLLCCLGVFVSFHDKLDMIGLLSRCI